MFVDELDDRLAEIGKYLVIAENQRKPERFNHTVIGMYARSKAVYGFMEPMGFMGQKSVSDLQEQYAEIIEKLLSRSDIFIEKSEK